MSNAQKQEPSSKCDDKDESDLVSSFLSKTFTEHLEKDNGFGKVVVPIKTGLGKTTAIVDWLASGHGTAAFKGKSVLISAGQVEELCILKRNLIKAGIPTESIGLKHSKDEASEPSEDDITANPIALVTHARLRIKSQLHTHYHYKGLPRNLVIYDESLVESESMGVSLRELEITLERLEGESEAEKQLKKYVLYLIASIKIDEPYSKALITPIRAELKYKDGTLSNVIGHESLIKRLKHYQKHHFRIIPGEGILSYRHTLPKEIDNIIVLDASYPVRNLMHYDTTMQAIKVPDEINQKSYEDVTLKQLYALSGRISLTEEFRKPAKDNIYIKEVLYVLNTIPKDEQVLIFTFKDRETAFASQIQTACEAAKTPLKHNGKPRIHITTWGNETSSNAYRECQHVILLGVLYRNENDLLSTYLGQKHELKARLYPQLKRELQKSEVLHSIYQALSRGTCRKTDNGKAKPMTAYVIYPDNLHNDLKQLMPALQFEQWKPEQDIDDWKHLKKAGKERPLFYSYDIWSESKEINDATNYLFDNYINAALNKKKNTDNFSKYKALNNIKSLLANLLHLTNSIKEALAISRTSNDYSIPKMYNPQGISYDFMVAAMDALNDAGLINMKTGYYDKIHDGFLDRSQLTRLTTTSRFIKEIVEKFKLDGDMLCQAPDMPLLVMKETTLEKRKNKQPREKQKLVEYKIAKKEKERIKLLKRYNALLANTDMVCHAPVYVNKKLTRVRRIFNRGSERLGGRFYGGWWQNMEKDIRKHITFNDNPTLELDYKALHVQMLYHINGYNYSEFYEDEDPYSMEEFADKPDKKKWRNVMKQIVLTGLNSNSRVAATNAIREELVSNRLKGKEDYPEGVNISHCIDLFMKKHKVVAHHFMNNDKEGLTLQYYDSQIAEVVIKAMTDNDMPVLCYHDGFRCEAKKEVLMKLYSAMTMSYKVLGSEAIIKNVKGKVQNPLIEVEYQDTKDKELNKALKKFWETLN